MFVTSTKALENIQQSDEVKPTAEKYPAQYHNMLKNWINKKLKIIIHQLKSDRPITTVSCKQQLLVGFQVLHCCLSYSRYTQCSLTVSSARQRKSCQPDSAQNSTRLWGQLHRPGALLTRSCPEATDAHYWLLSGPTAPSLCPWNCLVWVCMWIKSALGAERGIVMIR